MNPQQISQDDLVLFALQDLTPVEASEMKLHLEHSEAARAELAQIQGDLAIYALTSEPHAPPAQARERLLARIAAEPKLAPVDPLATARPLVDEVPMLTPRGTRASQEDEIQPRRSGLGFFGWVGWAVAAGCALAAGLEYQHVQSAQQALYAQDAKLAELASQAARAEAVMKVLTDAGAMQVALHLPAVKSAEPPRPEGHAAYIAQTGSLVFVGLHLAPLEAYKTYELWVIPADGHGPIPAGIFKPDQRGFACVILPTLPKGVTAGSFGVTIEDDGGAKSPTPPIVLAGM
ncbi:MAG: anti-sigma factor [Acidobacteriaceae bacterium]